MPMGDENGFSRTLREEREALLSEPPGIRPVHSILRVPGGGGDHRQFHNLGSPADLLFQLAITGPSLANRSLASSG
jgi:hypothetical protein